MSALRSEHFLLFWNVIMLNRKRLGLKGSLRGLERSATYLRASFICLAHFPTFLFLPRAESRYGWAQ